MLTASRSSLCIVHLNLTRVGGYREVRTQVLSPWHGLALVVLRSALNSFLRVDPRRRIGLTVDRLSHWCIEIEVRGPGAIQGSTLTGASLGRTEMVEGRKVSIIPSEITEDETGQN